MGVAAYTPFNRNRPMIRAAQKTDLPKAPDLPRERPGGPRAETFVSKVPHFDVVLLCPRDHHSPRGNPKSPHDRVPAEFRRVPAAFLPS